MLVLSPYLTNRADRRPDRTPRKPSPLVGLLDDSTQVITPLAFPDGQWITSLHELIERWDEVKNSLVHEDGEKVPLADVEFLAPLRGRDVLCVGYNYKNHTM